MAEERIGGLWYELKHHRHSIGIGGAFMDTRWSAVAVMRSRVELYNSEGSGGMGDAFHRRPSEDLLSLLAGFPQHRATVGQNLARVVPAEPEPLHPAADRATPGVAPAPEDEALGSLPPLCARPGSTPGTHSSPLPSTPFRSPVCRAPGQLVKWGHHRDTSST